MVLRFTLTLFQVWICPACGKQDDGSPMIGCDQCDDWYSMFNYKFSDFMSVVGDSANKRKGNVWSLLGGGREVFVKDHTSPFKLLHN